jgi:hypothetical protein
VIHRAPVSSPRYFALVTLLCGMAAAGLEASETPGRFTQWVPANERAEAGLPRLTSDEAAVLDVMVRRELGARANAGATANRSSAPASKGSEGSSEVAGEKAVPGEKESGESSGGVMSFSERLSADERRLAGFEKLTAAETAKINTLVERYTLGNVARALLAPPRYVARSNRPDPVEKTERKTTSGSFMLSYGFAKGGYSERTGAMDVTYTDPAGRYSVTVGYSETHVKGGDGRGMYLYDGRGYLPDGRGMYLDGPPYRP